MIFEESSPLRRLPRGLPKKQILSLDSVRYSVETATLACVRLRASAAELTRGLAAGEDEQDPALFAAAVSDAWGVIDSTHRLRKLLWLMPGLAKKQRSVELRSFFANTSGVEDLRNAVQHLDNEINALAETDQPVWGVLSWFSLSEGEPDVVRRCQLAAGTVFPSAYPAFKLEEVSLAPPVDRLELTAHGATVSLTDTFEAVVKVARATEEALERGLAELPPEAQASGSDLLMCTELRLGEGNGNP